MSQFLKQYNQFLLSKKVKDEELAKNGIRGANGLLYFDGKKQCLIIDIIRKLMKKM